MHTFLRKGNLICDIKCDLRFGKECVYSAISAKVCSYQPSFPAQTREGSSLEAANMLWLIQRDFLQGTSVQQMVNAALEPVDNPNKDGDIEEVS